MIGKDSTKNRAIVRLHILEALDRFDEKQQREKDIEDAQSDIRDKDKYIQLNQTSGFWRRGYINFSGPF